LPASACARHPDALCTL